jgi:hypothetical protein
MEAFPKEAANAEHTTAKDVTDAMQATAGPADVRFPYENTSITGYARRRQRWLSSISLDDSRHACLMIPS